ncbi:MAG: prepilin-type N-terminal cleavage/methylation domain-containing protein, partial [Synergistaceae bacterium]|nr:prepilin-type N-terminal cleavage/methylation domain-containing protein [Synergistaceae bacterium]
MSKGTGKGRGFTLIELAIAMVIAVIVIGGVVMLMGRGLDMVETNSTYSQIQNAALSSFEFLPKEIGYVDRVDIIEKEDRSPWISDPPTVENRWHYIAAIDKKVTEVYWDENSEAVRQKPLAGSINVELLMFSPKSKSTEKDKNVYREVLVRIETKDRHSPRNVVLERSIQVRADLGVTDKNGDPATESLTGSVLRFKGDNAPVPVLEIFKANIDNSIDEATGTRNFDVSFDLNMNAPDTWKIFPGDPDLAPVRYDLDTQFDAALTFDKPVKLKEAPIFTWIVADPVDFFKRLEDIGVADPAAFMAFDSREKAEKLTEALKNNWLDLGPEGELEKLRERLKSDNKARINVGLETGDRFRTEDPQIVWGTPGYGYRVVEISESVSTPHVIPAPRGEAYRVKSDNNHPASSEDHGNRLEALKANPKAENPGEYPRFQWGKTIFDNVFPNRSRFSGSFLIGIARYEREGEDSPEYIAAAVRLSDKMETKHLWDSISAAAAAQNESQLGNGEYRNFHDDFKKGSVTYTPGNKNGVVTNYGRGKFTVAAAHSVGSRGSQMMVALGDEYFQHLSEDLYGVTNYSIYIDKRLLPRVHLNDYNRGDFMPDGGLGVLLNGSSVETAYVESNNKTARENFSSGYMFEWDPGAGGMTIRFDHYSSSSPRPEVEIPNNRVEPVFFDNGSWVMWGVHPLYAYDAAKASPIPGKDVPKRALNAPAQIAFFPYARSDANSLDIVVEDFEDHVLPPFSMVEKKLLKAGSKMLWAGWGVYYRPPFLPRVDNDRSRKPGTNEQVLYPTYSGFRDQKDYRNGTFGINEDGPGPVPMKIFSRGRDNIGLNHWNIDANGWGDKELWFGGSFGTTWGPGGVASVYAFWHPQTWHLYENMQWEWQHIADHSREKVAHVKKDFVHGDGDYRSGWRFDIEYNLAHNINNDTYDFTQSLPKEWTRRHILKLTVLEVTRNIRADEVDPKWRDRIHHRHYRDDDLGAAFTHTGDDVIHKAGDLFVRAELIQLKRGTNDGIKIGSSTSETITDTATNASSAAGQVANARKLEDSWIYDSRNWVYSKPLWYGKFRGDGWRGVGEPQERTTWSLFKRMGMSMMHLVADPEPEGGDAQSFRGIVHGETTSNDVIRGKSDGEKIGPGRGVRVRSWKDHFRGWLFDDDPEENKKVPRKVDYSYSGNIEKLREANYSNSPRDLLHPDLTFANDALLDGGTKKDAPLIDKLKDLRSEHRLDGIWTPPAAIDLNGWALNVNRQIQKLDNVGGYYVRDDIDNEAKPDHPDFGVNAYDHQRDLRPQDKGFSADDIHYVNQWGGSSIQSLSPNSDKYETFGQYAFRGQRTQFERRRKGTDANGQPVYEFGYNGQYTDMLYVRLSLLRPDFRMHAATSALQEKLSKEPVWGLYAIRAWDYQRSRMGMASEVDAYIYDFQEPRRNYAAAVYLDHVGEARKRLLMVVQGLQLTYQPNRQTVDKKGNFTTPEETRYIEP